MKKIKKFNEKTLNQVKLNAVKGGEMARDTNLNRAKSASKIHDKTVQHIMS